MRGLPLLLLLTATPATAASFNIDAAGGYWFSNSPQFQVRLGVEQTFARIGERSRLAGSLHSGLFLHTAGTRLGIPVDLSLALHFGPIFFGAVAGPWFHFNDGDVVRLHVGGEFGVTLARIFRLSVEGSWLQPLPLLLFRFGVWF